MLLDRNAPENLALKQIFSGVDKLKAMGFKKKNIVRMISIHMGRRKSKQSVESISADLIRTLAGK